MPQSKGRKRRPPQRPRPSAAGKARQGPAKAGAGDGTGQPGRRPSSPGFLFAIAAMWIACGIVALVALHASWRLIPGVVFIGVGLFYLRGAAATVVRREERRP